MRLVKKLRVCRLLQLIELEEYDQNFLLENTNNSLHESHGSDFTMEMILPESGRFSSGMLSQLILACYFIFSIRIDLVDRAAERKTDTNLSTQTQIDIIN